MSRRFFKFTNFRNLGLEGNENNRIVINDSLKKNELGNVVILIGANNSGKSNVLDGILEYGSRKMSKRDITTLSFTEEARKPQISLVYQDDNGTVEHVLDANRITEKTHLKTIKAPEVSTKEYAEALTIIYQVYKSNGVGIESYSSADKSQEELKNEYRKEVNRINSQATRSIGWSNIRNAIPPRYLKLENDNTNRGEEYIQNEYGYNFEPKIINYVEKKISQSDMNTSISNLPNNLFFKSLFTAINIDINEIINGYNQYKEYGNPASLKKLEKMIEKKIGKLNTQFNKLYFAESDKYKFSIVLEKDSLSFGMARGEDEDPIMIEMQSTGFRWFFDLYFNFICSNELSSGDIIVMDEPATNLHPEGQRELRRFIKDFAIKNDYTFIIATHSPFLIDPDNYDELRLVSMMNNRSSIDNLFSAVNNEDPDSLLPIKDALTIKQNVLYDLDNQVIWVEGITDYNYLTMFKKLLNVEGITFIPYNGNGKTKEDAEAVLSKLVNIKFFKRGMLVDADKSGLEMAKLAEGTVFKDRIYKISDVNPEFKEIEDMFDDVDKLSYHSLKEDDPMFKSGRLSSLMKNTTKLEDYSEKTINNFKKLFEIITD